MPCYNPKDAWVQGQTANGKKKLVFKPPNDRWNFELVRVPCGKCIGCKVTQSREWALRCYHEAQQYEHNVFVTLTFNEENNPVTISKRDLQLFFKKLRKRFPEKKIRYFACGEYGEQRNRPHYHAIIFNFEFPDQTLWSKSASGELLYRSRILEELWPYGYSSIGNVTFESAAYVARYQFKKLGKEASPNEYQIVDTESGEIHGLEKEFVLMSKGRKAGEGIGGDWYKKYKTDTDKDHVHIGNKAFKIPRYYDKLRERENPESLEKIKEERKQFAVENKEDNTRKRLRDKKAVKQHQLKQLNRGYENGT